MTDFAFDKKIICPEDPTATAGRVKQYGEYYRVKYDICREIRPVFRIAEIGVRAGYSAWAFLQAAPAARYQGYDSGGTRHGGFKGALDWAARILRPYDTQLFRIDTQRMNALPGLDADLVDLFHVDGDHSEAGTMHDLELAYHHTRPGGRILVDDITYIDGVKRAAAKFINKMVGRVTAEFRPSLRGEMIITKTGVTV